VRTYRDIMQDSPVEELRKTLPRGNAQWPAFGDVWSNLQRAAIAMSLSRQHYLSDLHVRTMAVMGTGHEEAMKAHQLLLRSYGWF